MVSARDWTALGFRSRGRDRDPIAPILNPRRARELFAFLRLDRFGVGEVDAAASRPPLRLCARNRAKARNTHQPKGAADHPSRRWRRQAHSPFSEPAPAGTRPAPFRGGTGHAPKTAAPAKFSPAEKANPQMANPQMANPQMANPQSANP